MSSFTVEIQGLKEMQNAFKRYPRIAEPTLQKAMEGSAAILAKHTTGKPQGGPVPWRTGNLTQTFQQQIGRLQARWFPTANYALFVHEGHAQQPGRYVPAIGKRLKKGHVKGQPFMPRIRDAATPEINKLIREALDRINRKIAAEIRS